MRILHIVHTPRHSGAEMLVADLCKEHLQGAHISAVAALAPPDPGFDGVVSAQESLGIRWLSPRAKLSRSERVRWLFRVSRDFEPHWIFAHSVIPALYARLVFPRVITVLHDASQHDYRSLYFRWPEYLLRGRTQGVIAVTEKAAENYSKYFADRKTKVIPNGIKLVDASSDRRPCENSSSRLQSTSEIVLQVGRVSRVKRQHLTIRAFAEVVKIKPRAQLLLAGLIEDDSYAAHLRDLITELGLIGSAHILGPRSDVDDLLRASSLFVMPSEHEAHSVALLEALSSGIEIITSRISAFEFASELPGVTTVDVEQVEQYAKMMLAVLGCRARHQRNLEQYTIANTAKSYIEFAKYAYTDI